MVIGMATMRKVTVTLPTDAIEAIRALVAEGKADSVSNFVQHAVTTALDDVSGWGAMLAKALVDTGGPMTTEERTWADSVLGAAHGRHPLGQGRRRSRRALTRRLAHQRRRRRARGRVRSPGADPRRHLRP